MKIHTFSVLCLFMFFLNSDGVRGQDSPEPELQCSQDVEIAGGNFTLSNGFKVGSVLRYNCAEGFYPYPVRSRQCQPTGKWTELRAQNHKPILRPRCKEIRCPSQLLFENGFFHPRKSFYQIGETLHFECYDGNTLRGSPSRTCMKNGKWNGTMAICEDGFGHCLNPGIPIGATKSGTRYQIDAKVRYQCKGDLILTGSSERVCQESREWTGTEPKCLSEYAYDMPDEVAASFGASFSNVVEMSQPLNAAKESLGRRLVIEKDGILNIYVLMDASQSISEESFAESKKCVMNFINKVALFDVTINFGIISFATEPKNIISVSDAESSDVDEVLDRIEQFQYAEHGEKTGTNIQAALTEVYKMMSFQKQVYQTGNKKGNWHTIRHAIILFTDGKSNVGGRPKDVILKIRDLLEIYNKREDFLDVYAFGVGESLDLDIETLNSIASHKEKEEHFFILKDLGDLQKTFEKMLEITDFGSMCGLASEAEDAGPQEKNPWHIQVKVIGADCRGSLINKEWVLTAAHCFHTEQNPTKIVVDIGDSRSLRVKKLTMHPCFDITKKKESHNIMEFYDYDIALLQLEKPITFSARVRPICIPCTTSSTRALKLPLETTTCMQHEEKLFAGNKVPSWFVSLKGERREVFIKLRDEVKTCEEGATSASLYKHVEVSDVVTERFLCTGGKDEYATCKGDSGGALFLQNKLRYFQVGVISWGVKDPCKSRMENNPSTNNDPRDFHISLFRLLPWLKEHLKDSITFLPLVPDPKDQNTC